MSNLTPTQERLYEFARAQFLTLRYTRTVASIQGMFSPPCERRAFDLQSTYVIPKRRKDEKASA